MHPKVMKYSVNKTFSRKTDTILVYIVLNLLPFDISFISRIILPLLQNKLIIAFSLTIFFANV